MFEDRKPSILVLDDQPFFLRHMQDILGDAFDLRLAKTAAQARKVIEYEPIDLALLDIEMPVMDGIEFFESIRELPFFKNTKVIFTTSVADPDTVKKALAMGAVGYLTKPVEKDKCLKTVRQALGLEPPPKAEETQPDVVAEFPSLALPKILALDDTPFVLQRVQEILQHDYDVRPVKTPAAAFKLLKEEDFTLLLLDVEMPGMTGIEFLEYLKKNNISCPRFVFLTSHSDAETVVKAKQLGASGYIVKPLEPDKLKETVKKVLGGENI